MDDIPLLMGHTPASTTTTLETVQDFLNTKEEHKNNQNNNNINNVDVTNDYGHDVDESDQQEDDPELAFQHECHLQQTKSNNNNNNSSSSNDSNHSHNNQIMMHHEDDCGDDDDDENDVEFDETLAAIPSPTPILSLQKTNKYLHPPPTTTTTAAATTAPPPTAIPGQIHPSQTQTTLLSTSNTISANTSKSKLLASKPNKRVNSHCNNHNNLTSRQSNKSRSRLNNTTSHKQNLGGRTGGASAPSSAASMSSATTTASISSTTSSQHSSLSAPSHQQQQTQLEQEQPNCHSLSYAYNTYLRHDPEEQTHWDDVCNSFRQYATFAVEQWANHQYRLHSLPESQRQVLPAALRRETAEFHQRSTAYKDAAIRNQFCLDCILRHAGQPHSQQQQQLLQQAQHRQQRYPTDGQMSKVSSVLKSLARDWSAEGKAEREMSYRPLLQGIQTYLPVHNPTHEPLTTVTTTTNTNGSLLTGIDSATTRTIQQSTSVPQTSAANNTLNHNQGALPKPKPPRVCVPGAGVGRLACELSALGYTVQGNEFSLYMLLASDFILNGTIQAESPLNISPWLLETRNVHAALDPVRAVQVPDVNPYDLVSQNSEQRQNKNKNGTQESTIDATSATHNTNETSFPPKLPEFSMAAGEFVSIYSAESEQSQWDAVVCCFFLDASPSVVEYLQVIHDMLKPGGYLLNFGPLLWHWSGPAMRPDDKSVQEYRTRYAHLDNKYLQSIDLSWQDIAAILHNIGFDLVESSTGHEARYTADTRSMMNVHFRCIYFVARKRNCATTQAAPSAAQPPAPAPALHESGSADHLQAQQQGTYLETNGSPQHSVVRHLPQQKQQPAALSAQPRQQEEPSPLQHQHALREQHEQDGSIPLVTETSAIEDALEIDEMEIVDHVDDEISAAFDE